MSELPVSFQHEVVLRYKLDIGDIDKFAPTYGLRDAERKQPLAMSFEVGENRRVTFVLDPTMIEFIQKTLAQHDVNLLITSQMPRDLPPPHR